MLDFFSIFSKGGIVLWCFQGTSQIFTSSVNALIKAVILQERTGQVSYDHDNLTLKYKLDNEFELVYVVAYQKILQLSYVDKFLNNIQLEFRDAYKNRLQLGDYRGEFDFEAIFQEVLRSAEDWARQQAAAPKVMKSFEESQKSKKTVASMIERKGDDKENAKKAKKVEIKVPETKPVEVFTANDAVTEEDLIQQKRREFAEKMAKGKGKPSPSEKKSPKPKESSKKSKESRVWPLGGAPKDMGSLDYTKDKEAAETAALSPQAVYLPDPKAIGTLQGQVQDMDYESSSEEEEEEEEEGETRPEQVKPTKKSGIFSLFKTLVGSKTISQESMAPILDKMKDHLIAKNVAAEIAGKLCDSVAAKLDGKVLGTFESLASTVKASLTESLVQILSPRRRVDILRDVVEAQRQKRPYVMSFCGVNGVGKSTNLAKICFWLVENNFRVLIAACDTFRAGAVEQLRTHMRHLNALHPAERHGGGPPMVQLYEKGYGKDAAGIALEAINHARESGIDVVMIDTAGRMQDNEPLMRALSKLIKVNEPDLVLFVGEALVGNEAVDQLVKFNQALADYSASTNPHTIDGIVLTKFDTIDDKVGAAISMTYITGQPIVFIGTGQTYADLKTINVKAVVSILMK